jgi:hypothetical protein
MIQTVNELLRAFSDSLACRRYRFAVRCRPASGDSLRSSRPTRVIYTH